MKVEILVLGPLDTNTYILSKDGKCIIIDPADDAEKMIALGVKRIGTSSAFAIVNGEKATGEY